MKRLITILSIAIILAGCGISRKKAHPDDPWPKFSYEKVDSYQDGKIKKVEYACFIGVGTAPTQNMAEMKAEADAQARMAEAIGGDKTRMKGVTRVGNTLIRYNQETRMYTVYIRVGVPAKNWRTY